MASVFSTVRVRIGICGFVTLLLLGSLIPSSVGATVISGTSSAFDGTFDATIGGIGMLSAGPAAQVSGSAPAPYTLSDTLASYAYSSGAIPVTGGDIFIDYDTSLSFADASSDVDGGIGSRTTDATGGISTTSFSIAFDPTGFLPAFDLLSLSVSVLSGTASVTGDYGSLAASGSGDIIGGSVYVFGIGSVALPASPGANTVVLGLPGISLVLNEQVVDCAGPVAGTDTCSMVVNAVHLDVDTTIGAHTVDSSVLIGHAEAMQVAVPEPTTAVLLIVGLVMLANNTRRSN